jgi:hypothetical protein
MGRRRPRSGRRSTFCVSDTDPPGLPWPDHGSVSDHPTEEILLLGAPARAVVVRSHRSGLRSGDGLDLYALVLNVSGGCGSRQVNVGAAVPGWAQARVRPGVELPVRILDDDVRAVAVDFAAALAEDGR